MNLEVGMYVRTKSFKGFPSKIGKITKVEYNAGINNETYIALDSDEESCRRWTEDWLIGEPSHNIIDLIEVGDYVNGLKITEIVNGIKKRLKTEYRLNLNYVYFCFYENDIESIVTKEQFEAIKYEL